MEPLSESDAVRRTKEYRALPSKVRSAVDYVLTNFETDDPDEIDVDGYIAAASKKYGVSKKLIDDFFDSIFFEDVQEDEEEDEVILDPVSYCIEELVS